MSAEEIRSRAARRAAEDALIRIIHHYGRRPEFVILGGLCPDLLCSEAEFGHAGTTDIDVQVDLEIASGSVNAARLEEALRNAEFDPDPERPWRWIATGADTRSRVKFELLTDLADQPAQTVATFDGCEDLGACNLRGTGFASRDATVHVLRSTIGGQVITAEVLVTGLGGFLLAKAAAARARTKRKDWYDVAFVLVHNDAGGPIAAAEAVIDRFAPDLPALRTTLEELATNFADAAAQGTDAYVGQMHTDHPHLDQGMLAADAILAVEAFCRRLEPHSSATG